MNDPWAQQQPNPWSQTETISKPDWMTQEIQDTLIANNMPVNQDGMLMLWQNTKAELDRVKEMEMERRKICVNFLVPTKQEGTTNVALGGDWNAKVVNKFNYKLDSDNDKVWAGLEQIEKLGNEGKFVADRLVSWTPNFLLSEYRQLQEDAEKGSIFAKQALEIITTFMTITDAAPTLEVAEKKRRK